MSISCSGFAGEIEYFRRRVFASIIISLLSFFRYDWGRAIVFRLNGAFSYFDRYSLAIELRARFWRLS